MQNLINNWPELRSFFQLHGSVSDVRNLGPGLINDSFCCASEHGTILLQQLNTDVFTQPQVIENTLKTIVPALHTAQQQGHYPYRIPSPINHGRHFCSDTKMHWRAFQFVDGTTTLKQNNVQVLEQAALAYARYVYALSSVHTASLQESIPNFHAPWARLKPLHEAVHHDIAQRATLVDAELAVIATTSDWLQQCAHLFNSEQMPKRVVHYDTKLSNLLFDAQQRVLAVVDWDTTMPGFLVFDFGDLVRSAVLNENEDANTTKITIDSERFMAIARGYRTGLQSLCSPIEREHLYTGALLITLELAIRFLTDYLNGDRYFKTEYSDQNLMRARHQLALFTALREAEADLRLHIQSLFT